GHVVEIVASPSYSITGPSSVHGGTSGKFELQSSSNWSSSTISSVPPRMSPVPRVILTRTVLSTWLIYSISNSPLQVAAAWAAAGAASSAARASPMRPRRNRFMESSYAVREARRQFRDVGGWQRATICGDGSEDGGTLRPSAPTT